MKKISMKEFDSMLESDKDFAARLKDYLGDTEDPQAAGEKTMEFLKKEGYELDKDTIEELSDDDLENVSGGGETQSWGDWATEKAANAIGAVGKWALEKCCNEVKVWWYRRR